MRKELVLTIPATEKGTEVIVRDYHGDEGCILIQHDNYKFGVSEKFLMEALEELRAFRTQTLTTTKSDTVDDAAYPEIVYGEG